ncbi:zinc finger protein with KRAB and SCAN domains 3-like [Mytilus californianus]|uniref:zinc finger protein with KRAB and SCAN domains 3-like n=1 Tax=Mytilus californianus TaxID=6549 RepID=UPI002246E59A|nr:zinc finger protein with KRAB and SCAN domains 3-like [Mytilus californianus]
MPEAETVTGRDSTSLKEDEVKKSAQKPMNLQIKMRSQTGDKLNTCDICGKGFAHSSALGRHKRTQTGDKPYRCDVCGIHIRTHTNNKPYKCDVCSKSFAQSSSLRTHIRTHTGDKPYKCEMCGFL